MVKIALVRSYTGIRNVEKDVKTLMITTVICTEDIGHGFESCSGMNFLFKFFFSSLSFHLGDQVNLGNFTTKSKFYLPCEQLVSPMPNERETTASYRSSL